MSKSQISISLLLLMLLTAYDAFSIRPVPRNALLPSQQYPDKAAVVSTLKTARSASFIDSGKKTLLFAAAAAASSTVSKRIDTKEATTTDAVKGKMGPHHHHRLAPITSSIHRPSTICGKSDPSLWDNLAPKLLENPRGVDVRVHWTSSNRGIPSEQEHFGADDNDFDYFEQVADTLLDQIKEQQQNNHHHNQQQRQKQQHQQHCLERQRRQLAASMEYFTIFCNHHLVGAPSHGDAACAHHHEFTARIVSSRGAVSTKCPSWHQDHVPIRWIQALSGPGCQWIDPEDLMMINKSGSNNSNNNINSDKIRTRITLDYNDDDDDDHDNEMLLSENIAERNKRLVDPRIPQQQAAPGEAVMLMGQRWHEFAKNAGGGSGAVPRQKDENLDADLNNKQSSPSSPPLLLLDAVVHKSPDGILPWQGRVLLTMDVLVPPPSDST